MAESAIQWTDATWNPSTGCDRVSPGCANCYAMSLAARWKAAGQPAYQLDGDPRTSGPGFAFTVHPERLDLPLRWAKPRRIFVDSMSDLFHEHMPFEFLADVVAVMAIAERHTFQVLTKRPEGMRAFFTHPLAWLEVNSRLFARGHDVRAGGQFADHPIPNVWLGTSVENARWRTRIDELRATPAAVRFLSCEPLLGPLVLPATLPDHGAVRSELDLTGIAWVIVGGESGAGARPMAEEWVRDIIAACRRQGVAVFVKQMGDVWSRANLGHGGHAGKPEEWPEDLRIREFPGLAA